jgi:hypothetical protein
VSHPAQRRQPPRRLLGILPQPQLAERACSHLLGRPAEQVRERGVDVEHAGFVGGTIKSSASGIA